MHSKMLLHAAAAQLNHGHDAACWGSSSVLVFVSAPECRDIVLEAYVRTYVRGTWYVSFAMRMRE